jgi:hypothetical protein
LELTLHLQANLAFKMDTMQDLQQERRIGKTVMTLTVNLQMAIQMHMMKAIDTGMMMGGLEENIILILILQLQQALVRQQRAMMMVAINISISIMIVLRQVLALVQQLVVAAIIMIVLRQVLALVQQLVEEVAQQVRVQVQQLVVDQRQQVQAVPLQAEVIQSSFLFFNL